jgi:hypothetical protein
MRAQLLRMQRAGGASKDVLEIASKALAAARL